MKINLCHINLSKDFRGGEIQTILLAEKLKEYNIKQTIVVRKKSLFERKAKSLKGIKIISLRKPYFLKFWKLRNFDIIHNHEAKGKYISYLAKRAFKVPYVITRRVTFPPTNTNFSRNALFNADRITVLSKAIKQALTKVDNRLNIDIIPSAVSCTESNPQKVKALREKFKNKFTVGNIGAVVDNSKGHKNIVEAAEYFEKQNKDILFIVIGYGKDYDYYKNKARNLSNIIFIGYTENISNYIKNFDVFIFPSLSEGLGSSIIDAMYHNVPVIASNVGGIPELVTDHKTGLLIEPDNTKELCEKISILYKDIQLRSKLIENAKKNLSNYNIDIIADKYNKLYRIILGKK
ncbi:MAG: glycosyltransferase family 4 protein [Victivallales bacterium]|nr:glycosyltransferase family 4 protein [Victivallales bacterium]